MKIHKFSKKPEDQDRNTTQVKFHIYHTFFIFIPTIFLSHDFDHLHCTALMQSIILAIIRIHYINTVQLPTIRAKESAMLTSTDPDPDE